MDGIGVLREHIHQVANRKAEELKDDHQRVRSAIKIKGISYNVEPKLPADIIGIYVFLPVN